MYADHFGLTAEPFNLTPDPAFLYLSQEHREALAAVQYGLLDGRGFITLVGEVGTGKTTLLYSILSRRHGDLTAAYLSYSAQSFEDLMAAALRDLGVPTQATSKRAILEALNDYLRRQADQGRNTAIIIDEAQNLTDEAFEELRLLSNFESYTRKLVQIVLVGQPELAERLHQPRLRQLRERISVRAYVNPLSRPEMTGYVAHRLKVAGGDVEQIFSPKALSMIVRRTGGVPRRANILCHNALLFTYGRHLAQVGVTEAREAIAEMDERRPGRMGRRSALRRLHWRHEGWRWAAALGSAVAVGTAAGFVWSLPSHANRAPSAVAEPASQAEPAGHSDLGLASVAGAAAVAATLSEPSVDAAIAAEPTAEVPAAPERPAVAEKVVTREKPAIPQKAADAQKPVVARKPVVEGAERVAAARPVVREEEIAPPADPSPSDEGEGEETSVAREASRSVVVPTGGALWTILRKAYGDEFSRIDRAALYHRVRMLNPQVKNVNVIMAGDQIRIPLVVKGGR
jgi:general secretion pathway protein A